MLQGDYVYHRWQEFFGTISNIYLDGMSEIVYYGVHGLNGKYLGSFPAFDLAQSSRC